MVISWRLPLQTEGGSPSKSPKRLCILLATCAEAQGLRGVTGHHWSHKFVTPKWQAPNKALGQTQHRPSPSVSPCPKLGAPLLPVGPDFFLQTAIRASTHMSKLTSGTMVLCGPAVKGAPIRIHTIHHHPHLCCQDPFKCCAGPKFE